MARSVGLVGACMLPYRMFAGENMAARVGAQTRGRGQTFVTESRRVRPAALVAVVSIVLVDSSPLREELLRVRSDLKIREAVTDL